MPVSVFTITLYNTYSKRRSKLIEISCISAAATGLPGKGGWECASQALYRHHTTQHCRELSPAARSQTHGTQVDQEEEQEEEDDSMITRSKPRHFTVSVPPNLNSKEKEVNEKKKNKLTTLD